MKNQFNEFIQSLQDQICQEIETLDGVQKFKTDAWQRADGGGGVTRVIQHGRLFEKGGVNISTVHGPLTNAIKDQLKVDGHAFFACGLSLVIHPFSPKIPTVHANYRYFEIVDETGKVTTCWFGGGADLTPYYLVEEDAILFHEIHKKACDSLDKSYYPLFKKNCDDYFVNHHRNGERRGIGGIFYDYQKPNDQHNGQHFLDLAKANGKAFIDAYSAIVKKHDGEEFSEAEKKWQLIRRGRYVEFNLIHDRGTIFGLKSGGRTESILMTLPLNVQFEYDYPIQTNSPEEKLVNVLRQPKDWI